MATRRIGCITVFGTTVQGTIDGSRVYHGDTIQEVANVLASKRVDLMGRKLTNATPVRLSDNVYLVTADGVLA